MTGSVDNVFTHIQGGQCACYSCVASQLAEVIADRAVIMDESIEQAGRIAALEARCREQEIALLMCEEYFVAKGWAADRGPLLEKVQKALSSTSETTVNDCGCTIGSDK